MLENGGGSVINISSVLALISGRGFLSYGTAKGALARYTELAAQDLAPRIRVNAIAAGTIVTAATEAITADPGLKSRVEQATPLRRHRGRRRSRRVVPGLTRECLPHRDRT